MASADFLFIPFVNLSGILAATSMNTGDIFLRCRDISGQLLPCLPRCFIVSFARVACVCSCDWNLEKQLVFYDSLDITTPHMAFFAATDIEPFTELTFNYGYKPGSINGRRMECHCGAEKCQGFLL